MENQQSVATIAAPRLLPAELLYDTPPQFTSARLQSRLETAIPHSKLVSSSKGGAVFLIAHENHVVEFENGQKIPAQTAIMSGNTVDQARYLAPLQQTRNWAGARSAVERSRSALLITEMLCGTLDAKTRVNLFFNVLVQALEIAPPNAVYSLHAESILDPAAIIRSSGSANFADRMSAFLNVRLYRVENSQSRDVIMDTRGLAELGLPDIQIHFRGLDAGKVAAHLYNTAMYINEYGDRIQDGHTIQGLTASDKWRCQHEEALAPPKRIVLDLDPGDPFAAGKRHRVAPARH